MLDGRAAWSFAGRSKEQVLRLVASLGLDRALEASLARTLDCKPGAASAAACTLKPDLATVGALSTSARALVAEELAAGHGLLAHHPVRRRLAAMERWLGSMAGSAGLRAAVRSLLVPAGDDVVFFDRALVCSRVLDPGDRIALVRATADEPGLFVRLRVPERADVGALAAYWGGGGRREEVSALLVSLASAPGGGAIDVVRLLPPFARARALEVPSGAGPAWDAASSAVAFFGPAEAAPIEGSAARARLEREYRELPREEGRLGDVVEIAPAGGGGVVTHAVLIADDIVLAKIGAAGRAPWIFARLADVVLAELGEPAAELSVLRRREAP